MRISFGNDGSIVIVVNKRFSFHIGQYVRYNEYCFETIGIDVKATAATDVNIVFMTILLHSYLKKPFVLRVGCER